MAVQAPNTTLLSCGKTMLRMEALRRFREQPISSQSLGELVTIHVASRQRAV